MAPAEPDCLIAESDDDKVVERLGNLLKAVDIPDNKNFISFAESLIKDKIQIRIRSILEPYLSPKNAIGVTILSQQCGDNDFLRYTDDFVNQNLDMVIDNKSFRNLDAEDIQLYLMSTTLDISVTASVFSANRKFHQTIPRNENVKALTAATQTALICKAVFDDDCILDLLEIVKGTSCYEIGCILAPLISPKNCLSIAILAKEIGDNSLLSFVSVYICKNTDVIAFGNPLKVMTMTNFCRFFLSFNIDDSTKLRLLDAKLIHYSTNTENKDSPKPPELEHIAAITTALTIPCEEVDCERLGRFCHFKLKNIIDDFNCLDIAVLAHENRLDELQIWTEHHIINNFPRILSGISCGNYSKNMLRRYIDISSLSFVKHGMMLTYLLDHIGLFGARNSSNENTLISITESRALRGMKECMRGFRSISAREWLLTELRKLPSIKKRFIGRSGGMIQLDGCSLTFPKDALTHNTQITMTLNTNEDKHPETGIIITPILSVEPSMSFLKPVVVKMETCYAASTGGQVSVVLFSKTSESEWKMEQEIDMTSEYQISFSTTHFSDKIGKLRLHDTENGRFRLKNDVFIQQDTGTITSYFYCFEKDRLDIKRVMRMSNCACFTPHAVSVRGLGEDDIELEIVPHKLGLSPSLILKRDAWIPDKVAIADVIENGNYQLDADPGTEVTDLAAGSFVSGKYRILVNQKQAALALVKREWPVKLDPESREPPRYLAVGNAVLAGGIMNQEIKDCDISIG